MSGESEYHSVYKPKNGKNVDRPYEPNKVVPNSEHQLIPLCIIYFTGLLKEGCARGRQSKAMQCFHYGDSIMKKQIINDSTQMFNTYFYLTSVTRFIQSLADTRFGRFPNATSGIPNVVAIKELT